MIPESIPAHSLPAPEAFARLIFKGYSYWMMPDWQCRDLLQSGELVELLPGVSVQVRLFWHFWNIAAEPLARISSQLVAGARTVLLPQ
ncbi:MAG: hypothetical protein JXQ81_08480 [Desulfuromonadales bacterium]|nr:hypothetical protein [Desulfuromonadales bacterium]MBN2792525.1 hypothetical protein [Desulfuromonadales bacterium]